MNLLICTWMLLLLSAVLLTVKAQDDTDGAGNYDYGNAQYGSYGNYYGNYYGNMTGYGNYSGYYGNYSASYGNYSNYYGNYSYYDTNGTNSNYYQPPLPEPSITVLTDTKGVITSPGYPNESYPNSTYPPNAHFVWIREGDDKTLVQFKIWDLGIEIGEGNSNVSCDFDYLNVSVTSVGWRRYCGYTTQVDEIRGLGSLRLQLVSDGTANFWGFTSTYQVNEKYDPCTPNPCGNGKCVVEDLLPKCVCEAGYTGEQCTVNIKECESDPCENGGTCDESNQVNSYKCRCTLYYTGKHCEKNQTVPCDTTPCQNNGTCEDMSLRQYRCYCADGFVGLNCERRKGDPIRQRPVPQNPVAQNPSFPNQNSAGSKKGVKKSKSGKPKFSASIFLSSTIYLVSTIVVSLLTH